MATWPDLDELKQLLDIKSDDWDGSSDDSEDESRLSRVLASGIARVKSDIGHWDDYEDEPTPNQAQAALRMSELLATRPTAPASELGADPAYRALMKGSRRVFGIA